MSAWDDLPQSDGYAITTALLEAIRGDAVLSALPLVRNPRRPGQLASGKVLIILAEQADDLVSAAGVAENRQRTFSAGVVARVPDAAEAVADAVYGRLHQVAHDALRQLQAAGNVRTVKETGIRFQVDDVDVDGALVIGGWAIDYRYKRLL